MKNKVTFLVMAVAACAVIFAGIFLISRTTADTIYTTDGKEVKGIVVEEYKDRLVLSTVDGEVTVMKADIRELSYDSEEDNLIRLAEQAMDRRDEARALAYYQRALKLSPTSKPARDGLAYLHSISYRQKEARKEADIMMQDEIEQYGGIKMKPTNADEEIFSALENTTGMSISIKDDSPHIDRVKIGSPAYEAGVKKGDRLVAIWGKLTGFMSLDDILYALMKRSSLEIRCTIERPVSIPAASIEGSLSMEPDGLTVSSIKDTGSVLEMGDLVISVEGMQTRYMPLKKALDLIRNAGPDYVKLTLRRNIIIWRKKEI